VSDFRLLDYLVAVLSTDQSPALDGSPDSEARLKKDLADFGVFDSRMSLYLLLKLRRFHERGFSGFEARFYSLFEDLLEDMGEAVDLQWLLAALSYKYILNGQVSHEDIPDTPHVESERRQIFFGAAIGIPTFFVRRGTPNRFLMRILARVERTRPSRRYPDYVRVYNLEYRRALLSVIREDAPDLVEALGLKGTLERLEDRLLHPEERSAAGRLTRGILEEARVRTPLALEGEVFNGAAERYYRGTLKRRQMRQALGELERDMAALDQAAVRGDPILQRVLADLPGSAGAQSYVSSLRQDILEERAPEEALRHLIVLMLASIRRDRAEAEAAAQGGREEVHAGSHAAPVH